MNARVNNTSNYILYYDLNTPQKMDHANFYDEQSPVIRRHIPAPCFTDDQCYPKIKGAGAGMCKCYAASAIEPFDECEGREHCRRARCDVKNIRCYELKTYCDIRPGKKKGQCTLETEKARDSNSILLKENDKKVAPSSAVSLR